MSVEFAPLEKELKKITAKTGGSYEQFSDPKFIEEVGESIKGLNKWAKKHLGFVLTINDISTNTRLKVPQLIKNFDIGTFDRQTRQGKIDIVETEKDARESLRKLKPELKKIIEAEKKHLQGKNRELLLFKDLVQQYLVDKIPINQLRQAGELIKKITPFLILSLKKKNTGLSINTIAITVAGNIEKSLITQASKKGKQKQDSVSQFQEGFDTYIKEKEGVESDTSFHVYLKKQVQDKYKQESQLPRNRSQWEERYMSDFITFETQYEEANSLPSPPSQQETINSKITELAKLNPDLGNLAKQLIEKDILFTNESYCKAQGAKQRKGRRFNNTSEMAEMLLDDLTQLATEFSSTSQLIPKLKTVLKVYDPDVSISSNGRLHRTTHAGKPKEQGTFGAMFGKGSDDSIIIRTARAGLGLKAGDVVLEMNNIDCTLNSGGTIESRLDLLSKNALGSNTLNMRIKSKGSIRAVSVKRDRTAPKLEMIKHEVGKDGVAKIIIFDFDPNIKRELGFAMMRLKGEAKNILEVKVRELQIDLRGTPGGDYHAAINAIGCLTKEGSILCTEYNSKGEKKEHINPEHDRFQKPNYVFLETIPKITVFTDPNTASASEIFIVALKENKPDMCAVTIVGENTYGKQSAQSVEEKDVVRLGKNYSLIFSTKRFVLAGRSLGDSGVIKPDMSYKEWEASRK